MERLTLYKSSMLSQLEAKSHQMGRWERSLQQWEAKLKGHGIIEKPAPDVGPHGFRETPREVQREAQREVHRLSPREDPRLSPTGVQRETTREALGRSLAREEQRPWHNRPPSGSNFNVSRTDPQPPKPHSQQEALVNRQQSPVIYDYPSNIQPKSPHSPHNVTHPTSPRQQHPHPPRDAYYHPVQHQQHPHQQHPQQVQQHSQHPDYRTQGLPYNNAQPHRAQRHSAPPGSHRTARSPGRQNENLNKSYGKDDSVNTSDIPMTNYLYNSFNGSAKPSPDSGYTSVNHGYPSGAGPPAYRPVSSHHRPPRLQYQSSQVSLADAASDHESVHATSPRLSSSYHVLDHSVELEEITDSQGRRVYRRVTEI